MPVISVIIPTYNRAKLVLETIQSVLTQSYRDFEIIVVDDGSTDDTGAAISGMPVKYIHQENLGLPVARNTGIKVAQGKYIAILDSDDCLMEQSLEKRLKVLDDHPEVAFVYSQICTMDENSRSTGYIYPRYKRSFIREGRNELHSLMYVNHIPASTVMIRKSCLEKVGMFNPEYTRGQEDLEMWVRLSSAFASAYIAEPLVNLRIHSQRMTLHLNLEQIEKNHRSIIDWALAQPGLDSFLSVERPRIYSHLNWFMADVSNMNRDKSSLRKYVARAVRLYPPGIFNRQGIKWISMALMTLAPRFVINAASAFRQRFRSLNLSHFQQA